jgi:hypothetical protein
MVSGVSADNEVPMMNSEISSEVLIEVEFAYEYG